MEMRAIVAITTAILISGCAMTKEQADQGPDPKLQTELAGKNKVQTRSCISLNQANGGTFYRDAIVYRQSRARLWVAETRGCPTGRSDDYITVLKPFGSQICRGDLIRLIERTGGFEAGACSFGNFTEYRTPKS
jgi:hypothetical protein